MPELPEVETCVRYLQSALAGQTIQSLKAYRPALRFPIPQKLQHFSGALPLVSIFRKQKYLVFQTAESTYDFAIHLGMSGVLRLVESSSMSLQKHDHFQIDFASGSSLIFNDPRRFGSVILAKTLIEKPAPPCALKQTTAKLLNTLCNKANQPIKNLLLNQEKLSGLGNIYACEALFLAKISPKRQANSLNSTEIRALSFAIKWVLKKAIYHGGTSIRDFKQPNQALGYFQNHLWVYNREEQPCRSQKCLAQIKRIKQSGRSTFYCPSCQKSPRDAVDT